eukprot:365866-Chlamydomonas_euryale.AAC.3
MDRRTDGLGDARTDGRTGGRTYGRTDVLCNNTRVGGRWSVRVRCGGERWPMLAPSHQVALYAAGRVRAAAVACAHLPLPLSFAPFQAAPHRVALYAAGRARAAAVACAHLPLPLSFAPFQAAPHRVALYAAGRARAAAVACARPAGRGRAVLPAAVALPQRAVGHRGLQRKSC